ncbi:ribonuclease J [Armatimonas rosea]|uniref:Ribonuclease J n=1 Tax=Armatimonas rosea TaxID=685828 RepID=A0A7W9W752_ARMRO|nr:ribonuclease J [Armatimonas rosea]MBB6050866.1 ribonuclease J [Armatimonas rosea]
METLPPGKLRFIPLGGIGEIGKNLYVYHVLDQLLVVDCGLKFPDEKMFGVDLVLPDVRWLVENKAAIQGIVITHGHEDHIGALSFVLPQLGNAVPVYGPALALGLAKNRLGEKKLLDKVKLIEYGPDDVLQLGHFVVEPVRVAHSIPDSFGVAVRTHAGTVLHTGDFKLDQTPVDGLLFDIPKLSRIAEEGILAIVSDTTNVERNGYVPSERIVGQTFDRVISEAPGRVIIASFASQIHRMQMAVDSSKKNGRKVAAVGRSMAQNMDMAAALGYLSVPEGIRVRADDIATLKPDQITILTTGSQGEPLAGLSRMAAGDHRQVTIQKGDTVVLSSSPIPGNESAVWRVVNKLFALGANVIYDALMPVHVSGHGYAEELKLVLNICNPQYVIPVHGERRMLSLYAKYAQEMGWLPEDVFVLELGDVLELDTAKGEVVDRVPSGAVLIDGDTGKEIHELVLRDRQFLANDGFLNVVVVLDSESGELIGGPEFLSRGCFYMDSADELLAEAAEVVEKLLEDEDKEEEAPRETEALQGDIRAVLKKFIEKRTGRRPVILVSVMRV